MNNDVLALTGARIFDGERFHDHGAVIMEGGEIADLLPRECLDASIEQHDLGYGILSPGFIDVQVNGGGGVMLNDAPTALTMAKIAAAHRQFGTTSLLPTLISDADSITNQALDAAIEAVGDVEGVCGLHLEGPHLAPARKGAHLAHFMRPLESRDIDLYCLHAAAQSGPLLITVAAEQVTPWQVEQLTQNNVIVSIGHSDCSYQQAMTLFDAGARGVTHLFNAMSQIGNREPGLVGAALDHPDVWGGIIADGHHVHEACLRMAVAAKQNSNGEGKLFFVSDAMALIGTDDFSFTLNGRDIERSQEAGGFVSKLVLKDGTLAGSDITMATALYFAVERLGLPLDQAFAMATSYPARFLGLRDRGFIAKGQHADLVHLDNSLNVIASWPGGKYQTSLYE